MAREGLDRKISQLKDELLLEGSMVEQMTMHAVQALTNRDVDAAPHIYEYNQHVKEKHVEVESKCLKLLATEPPILATDLRLLTSLLEVNTALERIGDNAKSMAHICILIGEEPPMKKNVDIMGLAETILEMLHRALGAFVSGDLKTAQEIPIHHQDIKEQVERINQELVSIMIADPATIQQANKLLWVSHNLDRMANRVNHICERTAYVVTGELSGSKQAKHTLSRSSV